MRSDLDVKLTAGLGIFTFLAIAIFKGGSLAGEVFSITTSAISVTAAVRYLFIKWVWKWRIFKFLERVHGVPLLQGKWEGEIISTGNANTPSTRMAVTIRITISQPDISKIKISRSSAESTSHSFGEVLQRTEEGNTFLTYSYLSEPIATVRERSPISYGTARLSLRKSNPLILEGNYWSDQKTTGTLTVKKV